MCESVKSGTCVIAMPCTISSSYIYSTGNVGSSAWKSQSQWEWRKSPVAKFDISTRNINSRFLSHSNLVHICLACFLGWLTWDSTLDLLINRPQLGFLSLSDASGEEDRKHGRERGRWRNTQHTGARYLFPNWPLVSAIKVINKMINHRSSQMSQFKCSTCR